MDFAEKLKKLRKESGMSQKALADKIGVSARSVLNYENGARLPQNIEIVKLIAREFNVTAEYLMSEDEKFIINAEELYGDRGGRQAREVLEHAAALFAGGTLDDDEMLSFMTRIQSIYLDSKAKAKKYSKKS